jgi:broad specificity phosphatase PhoE
MEDLTAMELLIVRHSECLGQCDPSAGNDPDTPLSPLGEQQARQTARRLQSEAITHVLSSPLLRALATATTLADVLGVDVVDVWPELREGWNEPYQGRGRAELLQRFPAARLPASITDLGWRHDGDMTYAHFFRRAEQTLQRIKSCFGPQDRIVLVTHGGFANSLLHALLNIAATTPQWFKLANCSISHIRLVPEPEVERTNWPLYPPVAVEVFSINDIAHLTVEHSP